MSTKLPDREMLKNISHIMDFSIQNGGKVFVHCHAGTQRTGLIIAAYLAYATLQSGDKILGTVHNGRMRCLRDLRYIFAFKGWKKFIDNQRSFWPNKVDGIEAIMYKQYWMLHGKISIQSRNIPKVIFELCRIIRERSEEMMYTTDMLIMSFYNLEHEVFASHSYQMYIRKFETEMSEDVTQYIRNMSQNSDAITVRLRNIKAGLCDNNWDEFYAEKDVRVLVQLMLEYFEEVFDNRFLSDQECEKMQKDILSRGQYF
jgi:hypothetical protein